LSNSLIVLHHNQSDPLLQMRLINAQPDDGNATLIVAPSRIISFDSYIFMGEIDDEPLQKEACA